MSEAQKFIDLRNPRRIWAVGSIHAQTDHLHAVHEVIAARFLPGDRLVYLGNMVGWGERVLETVDALLAFRTWLLSWRGMEADDIVYLRGAQEEMWHKLLQLQFAPDPQQVLDWMTRHGAGATLAAYGGTVEQGMAAARGGTMTLGRWTQGLRQAMHAQPGHENVFNTLRRAAYCTGPEQGQGGVLLVSAGVDIRRPLNHQGDAFWWGAPGFAQMSEPYGGFARVVRGYDPARKGVAVTDRVATLDGNCGLGGHLVCGCLSPSGEILDLFQV
ncbi:hypothetical protein ABAZ39_00325 [Azospirillum argentinense]|uniref:Serine/threonine protein phosphatase n=1 Tax=Azospirillum argentinense TaxID=2970906 RepID=A0A060DCV4_9PROT|nr:hypothetical protein [Azospirillum argentinense]AIB10490.1 hypothetical protein ABAZ39_00325 [Azospirillum argentinense]EZQ07480.1 hypothetical protein ABAZ39_01745 [Azospirillum argentinense]PNQ98514.1 hypothetical protein C1S70_11855 [Azospirillum argentinense]